MTEKMRACLEEAVRERWETAREPPFPRRVLETSFELGAEGFRRETVWRALEIATADETPAAKS